MDAYPPQSLPSIKDIIGDKYTWTNSLNSVPKCIAYLEGVLNHSRAGAFSFAVCAEEEARAPAASRHRRGRGARADDNGALQAALVTTRKGVCEGWSPSWARDRWAGHRHAPGDGPDAAAVEQRWSIFKQRSPEAAIAPAAAPTYDLAVGDRITMGGAPGVVVALPNPGALVEGTPRRQASGPQRAAYAHGIAAPARGRRGPRRRRLGSGPARAGRRRGRRSDHASFRAAATTTTRPPRTPASPSSRRHSRKRSRRRSRRRRRRPLLWLLSRAGSESSRRSARPARSRRRSLSEPKTPSSGCSSRCRPPPPSPYKART